MMFASTDDDLVGPIYSMYNPSSPFSLLEFDGSILDWNSYAHDGPSFGTNHDPICTSSKGQVNGIVQEKTRVSKRGPSKADRHSKVSTDNGLRDRRMRLSLDVARQFFRLQDLLSYDKPSKTIKWLLLQAKPAIEELDKGKKSPFSGDATKSVLLNYSQGEVVESANIDYHGDSVKVVAKKTTSEKNKKTKKKKKKKKRVYDQLQPVAKEMRKEARERARERTIKKKQVLGDFGSYIGEARSLGPYNPNPCSSHAFETDQLFQDEILAQNWGSLVSLSYHLEEGHYKVNPSSESQQVPTDVGQYWFY